MDIDEWEFLPDDGFLDFSEDGEKQIFLGKRSLESKSAFDMDYFCSSPQSSRKFTEPTRNPRVPNQLVPLPILLEPRIGKAPEDGLVKEVTKNHPMEVTVVTPSAITKKIKDSQVAPAVEADHDTASQVFFKTKENEFVDMKMDTGGLKFEDKGEAKEIITSPRKKVEKEMLSSMECGKEEDPTWEEEENSSGFNIWKWSLTGVGAICSFGVAAATICVLFFGSQQRKKHQKIRVQIYADDKRIKQVVQHVPKLNEAISVVKGVPASRAPVIIGGYYDGL